MFLGLGTDIIEIERIRLSIARHGHHFLDKIFTQSEQNYCNRYQDTAPHYAGRFAAKEAIVKAIGKGFHSSYTWLDIEIRNNADGKPEVIVSSIINELFDNPHFMLSISHCRAYAFATAIRLAS